MHNELVKEYATKEFKTVTENVEEKLGFRIFFIGNGDYDVEVVEVHEIDFADVKRRLEKANRFSYQVYGHNKKARSFRTRA